MAGFKAALINEVEKLYKKKKVMVAALMSLIFVILGQLSITILRSGFGVRGASSMEFPLLVLSVVVNSILPLFTALVTIDSFSGEFSQNTMKITITRPASRLKFFTAKFTAIMIFVLVNLLFVMVISTITGVIFNSNSFTFHSIIRILISYLVTLIPMTVLALVIVLLTNILRNGISIFFISILIFIVFKALGIIFSSYSSLFFTNMLDWYRLWIMGNVSFLKIFRQFLLMLSYIILLFTGAYYLFDKKDF
ncbi:MULTISPECIES: ABC transporter permease [Clostridium]|jgi:ABC-2 type transport system permease protein|uniref:ABC-2 family transporter protein n=2 Tax=Clostridium TaxID=1485 RepID=A0A151AKW1_9CLOT|nr:MULTISPECIES: ABC transporter permease [Clostridium]KYH28284.1 ABC-2 family transporter protein [Clostridium colicanis DSM 13634]PRR74290.1 ABC-2 family transporter protein [Clostridium thermopalmarium DSM 5974]PVZ22078.1 ABC-2 type transport system permease protein [Clostridium thermopalmarium DSM 5974]